jgi:serine/threonine protein phosphatase PrpC
VICATVVTHPGVVRSGNEDSALIPGFCSTGLSAEPMTFRSGANPALYAVIDGMGGHAGGRQASRSVAFYLAEHPASDVASLLDGANRMLYDEMKRNPELTGMGATIAGVALTDAQVTAFNVGDARAYQYADGYLMLLTTDDRSSPTSHSVTQSLGGADRLTAITPHLVALEPLRSHDRLLICSDGLTEVVAFDEISAAISEPDPARSASLLLQKALEGGAPDNVTFILIESQGG